MKELMPPVTSFPGPGKLQNETPPGRTAGTACNPLPGNPVFDACVFHKLQSKPFGGQYDYGNNGCQAFVTNTILECANESQP